MRCEICGKPISGKPIRTKVDGAVLDTCKECSKLGRIQKAPPQRQIKRKTAKKQSTQKYQRKRDEPSEEIVENFGNICKQARESKGWSREQLGEKIQEKVSVIKKIESGKMTPELNLAYKFEKTLNIKIIEKVDNLDLEQFKTSSSGGLTLGSIVKIKK
ncbi:multiprotein bridging factor aMBF1 [Methanobrevibacter acididurans]|uniref:multiprotein bridging factor aMBF1 n=1 Tax=Methanobrevibacter acididurans TaxID=120963 RepID=UPI0038FCF3D1